MNIRLSNSPQVSDFVFLKQIFQIYKMLLAKFNIDFLLKICLFIENISIYIAYAFNYTYN